MTSAHQPLKVFFSYAHEDEELRDQLEAHLATLKKLSIVTWHDRKISPGSSWDRKIAEELENADLILLLISPDFMDSEACNAEMKRAMERHSTSEAKIIPIALRHYNWKGAPFSTLLGLPTDIKPVMSWADRDEAFTDISKGIWTAIEDLRGPLEPADMFATFDRPRADQPVVSMSLGLRGTLAGQAVNYVASGIELGEYRIDSGTRVILEVILDSAPPNGYAGFATEVYSPTMLYEQATDSAQEIFWPDSVFVAKAYTPPGVISHGCAIGIQKTVSHYSGLLLGLSLRCPLPSTSRPHCHTIYLLGCEESGAGTSLVDDALAVISVASIGRVSIAEIGNREVAAALSVTCRAVD